MLNEPVDDSGAEGLSEEHPPAEGQAGGAPPGTSYIQVTAEEKEAIERVSVENYKFNDSVGNG